MGTNESETEVGVTPGGTGTGEPVEEAVAPSVTGGAHHQGSVKLSVQECHVYVHVVH